MSAISRPPGRATAAPAGLVLPAAWSVALALLMLGPALGWGYVLSYDMVWVPDLALRPDALGLGTGLPRAVPSDAVVAVLDEVVPAVLLQKVVLVGALAGGGLGVAALLADAPLAARLAGVSVYQWNPFVVERLLIGHWPVLVCYALLPWIVLHARRVRADGVVPPVLWLLLALGSLSASAGLVTAVTLLAVATTRAGRASNVRLGLGLLAANAPWVVAGLLHASVAVTDPDGARLFALARVELLPAPLTALGLGGIWNGEVVLPSRDTAAAPLALAVLVALALLGVRRWGRETDRRERWGLGLMWLLGWLAAVLTWAAPGLVAWVGAELPGGGLLRDGARLLALCALPTALVTARGAQVVVDRVPAGLPRAVAAATFALLPVTFLPDAALGAAGRLQAVDYPSGYAEVRSLVDAEEQAGDVLVLPFASYREPAWNGDRKVLDPMGRFLTRTTVTSDELWVSDVRLTGEDPRVLEVGDALAAATPTARAADLAALGIALVVVDEEQAALAPEPLVPAVTGRGTSLDGFTVVRLEGPVSEAVTDVSWRASMSLAWAAYLGTLVLSVGFAVRSRRRR